jgi:AraC-like DNA-binding protein
MPEPESMRRNAWPDPRDLLPAEGAAALREEAGVRALFREIHRLGPAAIPSLPEAARLASMSEGVFKREFPKIAGRGWRKFTRRWRIRCSLPLLDVRRPSEKAVARTVGYGSTSAIVRAFSAEMRAAPRRYLQRLRKERARGSRAHAGDEE